MCGRGCGGVLGAVGASLAALGGVQVVAGVYFLLTLPVFQLGSNIWTGAWSVACGAAVAWAGWRGHVLRRGQLILLATLSVLVANVANLVIVQVGENGVFLTKEHLHTIVQDNLEQTLLIAYWLTTIAAALGIVVSFFGSQYLFCVVVRGARVKGGMAVTLSQQDVQPRQVLRNTRFASPCRDLTPAPGSLHGFTTAARGGGGSVSGGGGGGDGGGGSAPGGGSRQTEKAAKGKEDSSVPYFLRNHQSAWQFILPPPDDVVVEVSEPYSRTSTLSRTSKSSFQPQRLTLGPDLHLAHSRLSQAPSSCNTSVYSLPGMAGRLSPGGRSVTRVVRPSQPPPPPPPTANLREATANGWESCAVIQYPAQGGGFVVDLD